MVQMRGHNVVSVRYKRKYPSIIIKYSLLSRAVHQKQYSPAVINIRIENPLTDWFCDDGWKRTGSCGSSPISSTSPGSIVH